jgi:hypothetical protein
MPDSLPFVSEHPQVWADAAVKSNQLRPGFVGDTADTIKGSGFNGEAFATVVNFRKAG